MPATKSAKPPLTRDSTCTPRCRSGLGCCGHLQAELNCSERMSTILHLEYIVHNLFFFMRCQYGPDALLSTCRSAVQVVPYGTSWNPVELGSLSNTHAIVCDGIQCILKSPVCPRPHIFSLRGCPAEVFGAAGLRLHRLRPHASAIGPLISSPPPAPPPCGGPRTAPLVPPPASVAADRSRGVPPP